MRCSWIIFPHGLVVMLEPPGAGHGPIDNHTGGACVPGAGPSYTLADLCSCFSCGTLIPFLVLTFVRIKKDQFLHFWMEKVHWKMIFSFFLLLSLSCFLPSQEIHAPFEYVDKSIAVLCHKMLFSIGGRLQLDACQDIPPLHYSWLASISLKWSKYIFRKSQEVSVFNFDPKRAYVGFSERGYITYFIDQPPKIHFMQDIKNRKYETPSFLINTLYTVHFYRFVMVVLLGV